MKINNSKSVLVLLIICLFTLVLESCKQNKKAIEGFDLNTAIDNYIKSFPEWGKFNGVILVADRDSILFHKGYGMANVEFGIPTDTKTRFQIGSITKAFTAILILKLAEDGIIDLNKSVNDYLPYYPKNVGKKITIKHLISNTSGIPHHYQVIPDYFKIHDHYFHTPKELINLFSSASLLHNPGKEFTYSSPGYYLLGAILQQVTHKSYSELLQQYIFKPLGMLNTYVDNNRTTDENLATGYLRGIKGLIKSYCEDKSTALAAGDIISTAYDLYLWQKILNKKGDKILSVRSKEKLFEPVISNIPITIIGPHYKIPYDDDNKILEVNLMNGSSAGYVSYLARQTNNDRCVIVLSNVNGADVARIADDIGDIYNRHILNISIGEEAPLTCKLPAGIAISENNIKKMLGFYEAGKGNYLGIVQDDSQLFYLDFNKHYGIQMCMELTPIATDSFYMSHNTTFRCALSNIVNDRFAYLKVYRKNRCFKSGTKIKCLKNESNKHIGYFTSVELQETVFLEEKNEMIVCENFLKKGKIVLTKLEKDLFGFDNGFIKFSRDQQNAIEGFEIFTKNTDKTFGSKFIKIVY